MQLLRVRSNGMFRDTTYRRKYPTWALHRVEIWESCNSLGDDCLVPIPKEQSKLVDA